MHAAGTRPAGLHPAQRQLTDISQRTDSRIAIVMKAQKICVSCNPARESDPGNDETDLSDLVRRIQNGNGLG